MSTNVLDLTQRNLFGTRVFVIGMAIDAPANAVAVGMAEKMGHNWRNAMP